MLFPKRAYIATKSKNVTKQREFLPQWFPRIPNGSSPVGLKYYKIIRIFRIYCNHFKPWRCMHVSPKQNGTSYLLLGLNATFQSKYIRCVAGRKKVLDNLCVCQRWYGNTPNKVFKTYKIKGFWPFYQLLVLISLTPKFCISVVCSSLDIVSLHSMITGQNGRKASNRQHQTDSILTHRTMCFVPP